MAVTLTCPKSGQDSETVLHAFLECSELVGLANVSNVSHRRGRAQLPAESVIKMVQPPYHRREWFWLVVSVLLPY